MARGRKVLASIIIKRSKHVQDAETRITFQQAALTPTRRAENVERSVIQQVHVDLLEHRSPRQREAVRRARRQECRGSQDVLKLWREWALVIPVSQGEGPCGGRVDHSESSR